MSFWKIRRERQKRQEKEQQGKNKKKPFYEVFRGRRGQWYFHLKAANGKIVCQSEGYNTRRGATQGALTSWRTTILTNTIKVKKNQR